MSRGVETPHPHAYPPIENDERRRDRLEFMLPVSPVFNFVEIVRIVLN